MNSSKLSECFTTCETLIELYSTEQALNAEGEMVLVGGLSSVNNLLTLKQIVTEEQSQRTMEIGLAYGGSALAVLSTLAAIQSIDSDFHHTAIDPFQEEFGHAGIAMVKKAGYEKNFTCVQESSATALPALLKADEKFDLIYIDGSHIFEQVFMDAVFSIMLLNDRGILLFDDCVDPHIAKVIRYIDKNLAGQVDRIDLGGANPTKSLRKRIANRIGYAQMKGYRKIGELPRKWNTPFTNF